MNTYITVNCPRCLQEAKVDPMSAKIWCSNDECQLWFNVVGRVLTTNEANKIPITYKLRDLLK